METISKKKLYGLIIYIFIAIFQPPILPYDLIYISLGVTIFLIGLDTRLKIDLKILRESKLLILIKVIFIMFIYVLLVDVIDILFIENADLLSNRIRIINQLIILTGEEILAVYYVLSKVKKYRIDRYTLFNLIIAAGTLQGILSVSAFFVPSIRSFFLRYSGSIFENDWVLERRGYGFSTILVDTFGYGMALIAGSCLLIPNNNHIYKLFSIILMFFCILVNARTGIVIFLIAAILYMLKTNSIGVAIFKIILAAVIIFFVYYWILPYVLQLGIKSTNNTVKWIISDFYDLYYSSGSSFSVNDLDFISSIVHLPNNSFELLFGSGHSVYGTRSILGFATDIGYINLFWTYGILGSLFFLIAVFSVMWKTMVSCTTIDMKLIALFNLVAYFLVLVKGILLGYNPGTMTMYLIIFSINYFNREESIYV